MQSLRNARHLARLVLAWFALVVGVAVASPVVHPAGFERVCSTAGVVKLLPQGDAGGHVSGHGLDCPLCMTAGAPPPVAGVHLPFVPVLGHAVQPIPAARIAALTGAPLPARGPPAFVRA
jgi:hypothetical protein